MEKFSKWRDPGSGIQPFLTIKAPSHSGSEEINPLYLILNNFILGPLLGTLKFLFLLPILTIWFTLAWLLVGLRVPFPVLRGFDVIFGGISLFLMGFYGVPRKRMVIRPVIAALARPFESFSLHPEKSVNPSDFVLEGDWIIANLSSYCDLIVYWYSYSGIVTICKDFDEGALELCSNRFLVLWYYFLKSDGFCANTSKFPMPLDKDGINSLQNSLYPLIIFPEGVSSNGRGVLKFIGNLSSARRNQRIHLTCTKFHSALFMPSFPNPSISEFFYHLWRLCSQLENTLTSRTILPAALFSSNFDLPPAGDNPVQFNRSLQQIIAALGHLRPLNLDGKDKISFIKSFKAE